MGEEAICFETPGELRAWLEEHHATASELWVGCYKKGSGRRSLTWSEVVDEALCFGWIDGRAQRIDENAAAKAFRSLVVVGARGDSLEFRPAEGLVDSFFDGASPFNQHRKREPRPPRGGYLAGLPEGRPARDRPQSRHRVGRDEAPRSAAGQAGQHRRRLVGPSVPASLRPASCVRPRGIRPRSRK